MWYPKPCYNEQCYKEVGVCLAFIISFISEKFFFIFVTGWWSYDNEIRIMSWSWIEATALKAMFSSIEKLTGNQPVFTPANLSFESQWKGITLLKQQIQ